MELAGKLTVAYGNAIVSIFLNKLRQLDMPRSAAGRAFSQFRKPKRGRFVVFS
jgi:hypothetical protein